MANDQRRKAGTWGLCGWCSGLYSPDDDVYPGHPGGLIHVRCYRKARAA